jgi:hypothetical protein
LECLAELAAAIAGGMFVPSLKPPQRTWVGLTDERKRDMAESYFSEEWAIDRAEKLLSGCEAALQKENT